VSRGRDPARLRGPAQRDRRRGSRPLPDPSLRDARRDRRRAPRLSGLVLSLVDPAGRPQDGFLSLADIYNLDLTADLVVLSGCETALGREIRGEGLIGLVRGFLYAGSRRVVSSLWRVEDRATAELMARFYRAMLRGGESPAAALRDAQLALLRQRRWRQPYSWAGFVVQGDWRGAAGETSRGSRAVP
jgi:CHAT domain-containing protein